MMAITLSDDHSDGHHFGTHMIAIIMMTTVMAITLELT